MLFRMMLMIVLVPAALAVPTAGSMAGSATTLNTQQNLIQQRNQADIDVLNSIQGRQLFQLEQQRLRQEDRQMIQRREPLPEVPQFRPGCLGQTQDCR